MRFLSSLGFMQYAAGGLLAVILFLSVALWAEKRSGNKKDDQIVALTEKANRFEVRLEEISEEKKNQATVTTRTVERVVKGDPQVRVITRTIREAPLPANCATPALETLRNSL